MDLRTASQFRHGARRVLTSPIWVALFIMRSKHHNKSQRPRLGLRNCVETGGTSWPGAQGLGFALCFCRGTSRPLQGRHGGTQTAQDRSHEPCIKQQVSNMVRANCDQACVKRPIPLRQSLLQLQIIPTSSLLKKHFWGHVTTIFQFLGYVFQFFLDTCTADLLRLLLDHPRSQQPQIQEWQQKHRRLIGCA